MSTEHDHAEAELRESLLDAALMHVPFDGWSDATFHAAVQDAGADEVLARAVFPRGAVDLAVAYHKRGDALMLARLASEDLSGLRFSGKVAAALRFRLEAVDDKEAVRRGTTLFALPQYAGDGVKLIWGTVDAIWEALGDSSEDLNWYTKRATLAGVYSASVLFWLGDDSLEHQASWDFVDRRIANVMQFEKLKAEARKNPFLKPFLSGPEWLAGHVRKPARREDLPGTQKPQ